MAVLPTLPFGRTGHASTRLIFGAAALARADERESARALETVLELGINHIDTAASYGDAELRLAPWLREHRDRFFLATKTGDRDARGARESLHRSLERMGVDSVDLIQLHNLVDEEGWETAFGPGGALEALVEARQQGLVRFLGVTGHGTRVATMHARSLARFDFDSVLLPCSRILLDDARYAEEFGSLVEECRRRRVAIQTIKAIAKQRWSEGQTPTHTTWYEPLTDPAAIEREIRWVLDRGPWFVNSASDLRLLPLAARAVEAFASGAPRPEQTGGRFPGMQPIFVRGYGQVGA